MSSALQVRVDASSYDAASAVLGGVATGLADAGWTLVDALSATGGMAGGDAAGADWAAGYDGAAAAVVSAASDVITAGFRLAALLEQTGFNYATAESASVPGGTVAAGPDRTRWEWQECTLPAPPSAVGSGCPAPSGWSLVADLVGYVWPNGHQDRLRAAAAAWQAFASAARSASYDVTRAFACIEAEDAPETPDALLSCRAVESQLRALAGDVSVVAEACSSYADHLDEAHRAVTDELVSLLEWTAGIEAAGGILAVVSFGGSELAAQAAEAARISATAARIASVLSRFAALARVCTEAVADVAYRVDVISTELRPLLTSRIVVALAERAAPVRIATSEAGAAEEKLVVAAGFEDSIAGRQALDYATTQQNLAHVFVPKHNLERLVQMLGSREAVMKSLVAGVSETVAAAGRFSTTLEVAGQTVVVRGAIVDGVIRIGTAFTP